MVELVEGMLEWHEQLSAARAEHDKTSLKRRSELTIGTMGKGADNDC